MLIYRKPHFNLMCLQIKGPSLEALISFLSVIHIIKFNSVLYILYLLMFDFQE